MMVVNDAEDLKTISQHFGYDRDCSSIADSANGALRRGINDIKGVDNRKF